MYTSEAVFTQREDRRCAVTEIRSLQLLSCYRIIIPIYEAEITLSKLKLSFKQEHQTGLKVKLLFLLCLHTKRETHRRSQHRDEPLYFPSETPCTRILFGFISLGRRLSELTISVYSKESGNLTARRLGLRNQGQSTSPVCRLTGFNDLSSSETKQ